jgi:hypothetical protein
MSWIFCSERVSSFVTRCSQTRLANPCHSVPIQYQSACLERSSFLVLMTRQQCNLFPNTTSPERIQEIADGAPHKYLQNLSDPEENPWDWLVNLIKKRVFNHCGLFCLASAYWFSMTKYHRPVQDLDGDQFSSRTGPLALSRLCVCMVCVHVWLRCAL